MKTLEYPSPCEAIDFAKRHGLRHPLHQCPLDPAQVKQEAAELSKRPHAKALDLGYRMFLLCLAPLDPAQAKQKAAELSKRPRREVRRVALDSCAALLSMYINRSNAAWAASRGASVGPPAVWSGTAQAEWAASGDCDRWTRAVTDALHQGTIAVQLFALDDPLQTQDGKVHA